MAAYKDHRDDVWRYRKLITLPNGTKKRIKGTPAIDTMKAAEDAERDHINRLLHPERIPLPAPEPIGPIPTFKQFCETRFLSSYGPRDGAGTKRNRKSIIEGSLIPYFGPMPLDRVANQVVVDQYIRTLGNSPGTVNNKLSMLGTVLGYAGPSGCKLIPAVDLKLKIAALLPEMLPVPLDDVYKLVAASPDQRYVVAALLAAEAGLRIGEVRGAQWTDIKNGKLTIRRAIDIKGNITAPKHHKARVVPLSAGIVAALAKLPRRGIWIITRLDADGTGKANNKRKKDSNGSFLSYRATSAAIIAMYEKAKVTIPANEQGSTRPWHSLRHTFGTSLAMANVPVPTIAKLMGHADLRVTMRYVTVDADQMDAAVSRVFGRR